MTVLAVFNGGPKNGEMLVLADRLPPPALTVLLPPMAFLTWSPVDENPPVAPAYRTGIYRRQVTCDDLSGAVYRWEGERV